MPYPKQMQLLAKNPDILVATPGRLIITSQSGKIRFDQLDILVLDEADRMLDMGFIEDIETIIAATPETRQTMLFSATLDGIVGNMAKKVTHDAESVHIASLEKRHENIEQMIHFVDDLPHKNRLLDHWLHDRSLGQAVVFTATNGMPIRWQTGLPLPVFPRQHCMATCHKVRATGHWPDCAAAKSGYWLPPMSPQGASISRQSLTFSTTICRNSPKITFTASVGPAVPDATGWPFHWSATATARLSGE